MVRASFRPLASSLILRNGAASTIRDDSQAGCNGTEAQTPSRNLSDAACVAAVYEQTGERFAPI